MLKARASPFDDSGHVNERTPLNDTGTITSSTLTQRSLYDLTLSHCCGIRKDVDDDTVNNERKELFLFLEAQTPSGLLYERFTILLIFLSVLSFVISSLFVAQYDALPSAVLEKCGLVCDALWFGNDEDNALQFLGIGPTSVLEIFIILVFSVDYILRLYTCDFLDPKYKGFIGRLRFIPSFYSVVDLASTLPFYVDSFLLPNTNLAASNFLRMFRLLRMMRVEGRYDMALGMIDDVLVEQSEILSTGLFIGFTTWTILASFFFVAEQNNKDMIYCGAAPERCYEYQDDIDTSLCTIDEFRFVDCAAAGCPTLDGEKAPCWNVYRSIIDSSFWTLMELFGEFPLVDQHSTGGKVLGTFTAVFAVAVFAIPVGILGSGFEDIIEKRRNEKESTSANTDEDEEDSNLLTSHDPGDSSTLRKAIYNFLHLETSKAAKYFDNFINLLVIATTLVFMFETVSTYTYPTNLRTCFASIQLLTAIVFTVEYVLRVYSIAEDPRYRGLQGRLSYASSFLAVVLLLSFLPYWIDVLFSGSKSLSPTGNSLASNIAKYFCILRILRFEKYTKAFTTFDDIIRENLDVLGVTGFSALLMWILFSAILYLTERNNANPEMANWYKSVPHAMWITLLNLSGECPLAHYSVWGKITNGIIGLFATAIFGIPIGLLGAGFEDAVADRYEDTPDEPEETDQTSPAVETRPVSETELLCYNIVNGIGSQAAVYFELSIYVLIAASVTVGIIQTVDGYEDAFSWLELLSVLVFTAEYSMRLIGSVADPEFSVSGASSNWAMWSRLKYVCSFYSIIDLLAILPFYLAIIFPDSWFDKHTKYLRMFRLLRLLKLDKYFPSISLIDDVLRLKRNALTTSSFAAATMWILFAGLMYIAEYKDHSMEIDDLPLYNCTEDCTMSYRYRNFFVSMSYTGIHLTGDFPTVEYDGYGRIICFFMVIAAVGVVSVPSGLIASGFTEIVNSKHKGKNDESINAGDDWYDIKYREIKDLSPPPSQYGERVDYIQTVAYEFLNGVKDESSNVMKRSSFSSAFRKFFFALIIANIIAIIAESVPEIDKAVGNQTGNFFDVFEKFSVVIFTIEYVLRLVSAAKSHEALFSPWVYAITFFGIVDFLSIAPWYLQQALLATGKIRGNEAMVFRIFRIFRILQLEDFIIAFSKLDNVFRASRSVLQATGVMAVIIWCGSSALFYLFEQDNPNLRQCDPSVPIYSNETSMGCYDFDSTDSCNEAYPGMCSQEIFTNMPNTLYYVAVFLGGDWGVIDFTWQGRLVCLFMCVAGIGLYAIPVGTLFDSFGAVIGIGGDDDEEGKDDEEQ